MMPTIINNIKLLPLAALSLIGVNSPIHAATQSIYDEIPPSENPYLDSISAEGEPSSSKSKSEAEDWNSEFKIYFRAGMVDGMEQNREFKLPGAASKYRLGNEFDQYGEFLFRQDLARLGDGSIVSLEAGGEIKYPYGVHHFGDKEGDPRLTQSNLIWRNIPWLRGGALTAGRTLYVKNENVHIYDFDYQDLSGLGVGIQDVPLGPVKATWTLTRQDDLDQEDYVTRNNLLFEGLQITPGGFIDVGFTHIAKNKELPGTNSGWSASLQHRQLFSDQEENIFAVQYGEGPGTNLGFTGNLALDRTNTSWRLIDTYEWQNERFGGQVLGLWERDHFSSGLGQDVLSVGARTTYSITDFFKLALEVGHDRIKPDGSDALDMTKLTFAPILSPSGSGFWKRPEIRLFYTFGLWSSAAQEAADRLHPGSALSNTGAFGSALHGNNFGIQVEYWNDNYTPVKDTIKYMGW